MFFVVACSCHEMGENTGLSRLCMLEIVHIEGACMSWLVLVTV
jgi:hypothetical protein